MRLAWYDAFCGTVNMFGHSRDLLFAVVELCQNLMLCGFTAAEAADLATGKESWEL